MGTTRRLVSATLLLQLHIFTLLFSPKHLGDDLLILDWFGSARLVSKTLHEFGFDGV